MGEPDIPEATPWAWSRNAGGPTILKITRSKLGRRAFGKIPMTWMSKLTGALPWIAVSPVPAIPGTIELSGKTGGGLVHSVAAGALAGVRLTANIPTETVAARSALRREDLDRTLPDGITPSTDSSYVSDESAEKRVIRPSAARSSFPSSLGHRRG